MSSNLSSISNNGIKAGNQPVVKAGSERQVQKDIGDLGKALHANDVAAAQSAVSSLKAAAPTQNARTDFSNAVRALDQALKSNNTKGATEAFASLQQARKQVQQETRGGPARDVPQQPNVGPVANSANVQKQAPVQQNNTVNLQKQAQVHQHQETLQKAFITRQELSAKAADVKTDAGVGKNIDTTA